MNGFHVNAVGWVLTVNALSLGKDDSKELSDLWATLLRTRTEDLSRTHPIFRVLHSRSISLSRKSTEAFAALVDRMVSLHPERFSHEALRRRRDHWALQVALAFLLCWLAAMFLPRSWPIADAMVPTFFLMGCAFLIPTVTLWRAASAVKRLGATHIAVTEPLSDPKPSAIVKEAEPDRTPSGARTGATVVTIRSGSGGRSMIAYRPPLSRGRSLGVDEDRIERLAGSHEQTVALGAAKASVSADLGETDASD